MLSGKFFSINNSKSSEKRKSEYYIHIKLCLLLGAQSAAEGRTSLMVPGGTESLSHSVCDTCTACSWCPELCLRGAQGARAPWVFCDRLLQGRSSVTLNCKTEVTVLLPPLNTVKVCISLLKHCNWVYLSAKMYKQPLNHLVSWHKLALNPT